MPRTAPPALEYRSALTEQMAGDGPCWFAGLAERLVDDFWAESPAAERAAYNTAVWLGGPGADEVEQVDGDPSLVIETLPDVFLDRFAPQSITASDAAGAVAEAIAMLAVGGAGETVTLLVRSVHAIASLGPGYDCSHSEPTIPFSVFVSIPIGERDGMLRLAESLLHEAMHLQLTLIEGYVPMVVSEEGLAFSPWQGVPRPARGLLHGLYVFTAIAQWLVRLAAESARDEGVRGYVNRRLVEIGEEVAMVADLPRSPALSPFGQAFAGWCLEACSRAISQGSGGK